MDNEALIQENLRDEYKLVFSGYKFFVSVRFIVAAFAMTIQSALLTVYNQSAEDNIYRGFAVFSLAMIFWVALVIIERRTINLFVVLLRRGHELEFQIGNFNGFFHRISEISPKKGRRCHTYQRIYSYLFRDTDFMVYVTCCDFYPKTITWN